MTKITPAHELEIIELYQQGFSTVEIGRKLVFSRKSILNKLKKHKVEIREKKASEKIFSNEECLVIKRLYQEGFSAVRIGKLFNVKGVTISKLLKEEKTEKVIYSIKSLTLKQRLQAIELYYQGFSSVEIGRKFNANHRYILKILNSKGITIRKRQKTLTEEQKNQIIELYRQGISCRKIAILIGNVSEVFINKFLSANNITIRDRNEHKKADELSQEQKIKIIKLYEQGLSPEKIAITIGGIVSEGFIRAFLKKNNIVLRVNDDYRKLSKTDKNKILHTFEKELDINNLTKDNNGIYESKLKIKNTDKAQILEIISLYNQGISTYKLADKFMVTRKTISKALKRNNILLDNKAPVKNGQIKDMVDNRRKLGISAQIEIIKLYKNDLSVKEISKIYNVKVSLIRSILRENGELKETPFTLEQENEVVKLCKAGVSVANISKILNVPSNSVYKILKKNSLNLSPNRKNKTQDISKKINSYESNIASDLNKNIKLKTKKPKKKLVFYERGVSKNKPDTMIIKKKYT